MDDAMRKWAHRQLTESVALAIARESWQHGRSSMEGFPPGPDREAYGNANADAIAARHLAANADAIVQRERALVRAAWSHDDAGRADPTAPLTDAECDAIRAEVSR